MSVSQLLPSLCGIDIDLLTIRTLKAKLSPSLSGWQTVDHSQKPSLRLILVQNRSEDQEKIEKWIQEMQIVSPAPPDLLRQVHLPAQWHYYTLHLQRAVRYPRFLRTPEIHWEEVKTDWTFDNTANIFKVDCLQSESESILLGYLPFCIINIIVSYLAPTKFPVPFVLQSWWKEEDVWKFREWHGSSRCSLEKVTTKCLSFAIFSQFQIWEVQNEGVFELKSFGVKINKSVKLCPLHRNFCEVDSLKTICIKDLIIPLNEFPHQRGKAKAFGSICVYKKSKGAVTKDLFYCQEDTHVS